MIWQAVLSTAIFRHPKIRVCAMQAFVAGLFGFVALLVAIAFIRSNAWVLVIGCSPLVLWSFARSLKEELTEIRIGVDHLWLDLAKIYLEMFLVCGGYAFGELVLLAINLTINTGADLVQIHRLLNNMGGAHMLPILLGIVGGVSVIFGSVTGLITGTFFRK